MKFLHLADLHIGKRLNEMSLLEDQQYILNQILGIIDQEAPDAVLLAGDIYDKSVPAAEAVVILDDFLTSLAQRAMPVCMVSGNHDSPERLGFGGRIFERQGLHVAGVFDGSVTYVDLKDEHGMVRVWLLPFLKPSMIAPFYADRVFASWQDALCTVLSDMPLDASCRNVLVAHQFVTGVGVDPERSDSEAFQIGTAENIDVTAFAAFDAVALGHLHGPQRIDRDVIRYAGSPLKYSFSETRHQKSVSMIELAEKGNVTIRLVPLTPLRDMREVRGPLADLVLAGRMLSQTQDYIRAILTDTDEPYDAIGQLRQVYPNLMRIDFDNRRTLLDAKWQEEAPIDIEQKSPTDLFCEFFEQQNGSSMSETQKRMLVSILEGIDVGKGGDL